MELGSKSSKIETIRHSIAHILAASVQELFPGTKFGIGPVKIAKIPCQGVDKVFELVILKSVNPTALLWLLPNDGSFLLS